MSKIQLVYITAPNLKEANFISRKLLDKRLAACVNILPQMKSFYWWKGKIEEAKEVVVIAKTTSRLAKRLVQEIEEIHSYETPCALTFKIQSGSSKYMKWIITETERS
jgi:periplasmic divalent cation tolerance protein